jgi:hypothetical protein
MELSKRLLNSKFLNDLNQGATGVGICLKQISFHLMPDETVVFKKEIDFSKFLF